jgi:signal recognition particle receptor subunit beta
LALINHRTHEIHFKIVYYGPGLCGKTTNLKSLHDRLPPERRGRMISIATDQERTLFFDFLPIDLGTVNGFLTRFHLYTVPGQVYYKLSRRAVLQGVDGLVFVADSHPAREVANRESLADLNEHLRTLGLTGPALTRIPWVYQWNKRDVPVAIPLERLKKSLNPQGWPEYEAIASEGKGVSETLRAACKAVLARLSGGAPAMPATPQPAAGAAPPLAATQPAAAAPAHNATPQANERIAQAAAPAPAPAPPASPSPAARASALAAPVRVPAAAAPAAPAATPASGTATVLETPAPDATSFAAQLTRAAAAAAAKLAGAGAPATPSGFAAPRPQVAPPPSPPRE